MAAGVITTLGWVTLQVSTPSAFKWVEVTRTALEPAKDQKRVTLSQIYAYNISIERKRDFLRILASLCSLS